jgi:methylated-DNA-[protein]-cysteine S-methyltransferase
MKKVKEKLKKDKIKITEFERKVYAACQTIPYGETRSYAWVAQKIGQPRACRAVGNALHKNPFAPASPRLVGPAVPCHRVICSDGRIGGFAAGVKKKIRLLRSEGSAPRPPKH